MKQRSNNCNTLQHAIGPVLVLAQCFGVLPVAGVWPRSKTDQVRFRWLSVSLLVSVLLFCFCVFDFLMSAQVVVDHGLKIYTIGSLSFSVICIVAFGVFLLLARNWPLVIQQTALCELIFIQRCYACRISQRFSHRIRVWAWVLLLAALCEHCSYFSSALYKNYWQIRECNPQADFWQNYFTRERPELFVVFRFSHWLIPIIEYTTLAMTFVWNFVDIFMVLLCRSLEMRYQQLHWRIKQHAQERMSNDFWQLVRSDLLCLSDLLKLYDKQLSGLILLSCSHNMYFLCVQIYHGFQIRGSFMDELYFWFSLVFVFVRLLSMMFAAASIPAEAKNISYTLYEIPTDFWCLELKRLNEILTAETFALSGKGYFFLTRRLIFAMAATLMVYELVLINQMEGTQDEVHQSFCKGGVGSSNSPFS